MCGSRTKMFANMNMNFDGSMMEWLARSLKADAWVSIRDVLAVWLWVTKSNSPSVPLRYQCLSCGGSVSMCEVRGCYFTLTQYFWHETRFHLSCLLFGKGWSLETSWFRVKVKLISYHLGTGIVNLKQYETHPACASSSTPPSSR
jgi:hypothetical protein